jgi:hypothetical protein
MECTCPALSVATVRVIAVDPLFVADRLEEAMTLVDLLLVQLELPIAWMFCARTKSAVRQRAGRLQHRPTAGCVS